MTEMRFHLVSYAHTRTTRDFIDLPFMGQIMGMADMMTDLGHEVILYSGDGNDTRATEHVTCITKHDQEIMCGVTTPESAVSERWQPTDAHWLTFTQNVIDAMRHRIRPQDIILLPCGYTLRDVVTAFPAQIKCEYTIGYMGWDERAHHVFLSSAWMHTVMGKWLGGNGTQGRFFDRVIPCFLDASAYPVFARKRDYLLFVGRRNQDKGVQIAIDTARAIGAPLVVAGRGPYPVPSWVDDRGYVTTAERTELMMGAAAVMVPSIYLEPGSRIVAEANMCGTPVITTDWGGFVDDVQNGVNGWRCHMLRDFVEAATLAMKGELHPHDVRHHAVMTFSTDVIGVRFEAYFKDLMTLHDRGWYTQ